VVKFDDLRASYQRISKYLVNTPIVTSERLNSSFNANLFLKNEVEQLTG